MPPSIIQVPPNMTTLKSSFRLEPDVLEILDNYVAAYGVSRNQALNNLIRASLQLGTLSKLPPKDVTCDDLSSEIASIKARLTKLEAATQMSPKDATSEFKVGQVITGQYGKLYPLLANSQSITDKHNKKNYRLHPSLGLVTAVTYSKSDKKKFRVVDVFDPTVEEVIVSEDNTFMDADGRWYYQSLEESVEESTEEPVEPIESLVPIQEVAVIAPESTLEVSGDISEIILDALESTLDTPTLPDATSEETLTRDEFMAKWDMRTDTVEGNQAYSKAFDKTKDGGFWTAPDGSTWTRTGRAKQARWTKMSPATV